MSEQVSISIAMCTYNGERFLQEQLDSFLTQTRLPDELVVCDDGSQDGTVALLEAFARHAPFKVRIFVNQHTLGFGRNFEKASSLCQGEIIFFSDQDDVWLPAKLSEMQRCFQENPQAAIVFHDAAVVNSQLEPLGYSTWKAMNFTPRQQKQFTQGGYRQVLLKRPAIAGMLLGVRRSLLELVLPIPEGWTHDNWIPFCGSLISGVTFLPLQLSQYRLHSHQLVGVKKLSALGTFKHHRKMARTDHYNMLVARWEAALARITADPVFCYDKEILHRIKQKIAHLKVRAQMPGSKITRVPIIVKELITGRYFRYSPWQAIIKDILI
jgi:glycosyltransferase involved in cell wall biosynthesis